MITGPGLVFMVVLGALLGAIVAFFRARVVREVFVYVGLGVVGFALGQILQAGVPLHLLQVGVVNVEEGILGAVALFVVYPYVQRFWRRARRRRRW